MAIVNIDRMVEITSPDVGIGVGKARISRDSSSTESIVVILLNS
jgi:hypothetical protein